MDEPDVLSRFRRGLPLLGGLAAIVLLLAFAAGVRFAASPGDPGGADVAGSDGSSTTTAASTTSDPGTSQAELTSSVASTTTTTIALPTYGGAITVGVVGTPDSLNPFLTAGNDDSLEAFRSLMWASAMRLDPQTLEPEPGVVEETPTLGNGGLTINPDGTMTVRYVIRRDAVWEDGTPIGFDDFLRTYEVATEASNVNPRFRARYSTIVDGSVQGEGREVSFTVERPTLEFVELFDVLLPAHQVEVSGFASAWDEDLWLSAGPYRYLGRDGDTVEFAANPAAGLIDDRGNPLPYLDSLFVRFFRTEADAADSLFAGEVDVIGTLENRRLVEQIDDDESLAVDVRYGPLWQHLSFQFGDGRFAANDESMIDDVELRREVARLVDRRAMAEAALGRYARAVDSMIAFSWPSANTDAWSVYEDQPTTGCCEGAVITLVTSASDERRADIAAHVVERLGESGIEVLVEFEELGRLFQTAVIPGDFELAQWAWTATLGPAGAASDLVDRYAVPFPDGNNFSQFAIGDDLSDAELEFLDLVEGLDAVLSYDDLRERVTRIERILADQVVVIPLFADLNVGAYRPDVVGGFVHATPDGGVTSSAATWWVRR